MKTSNKLLLAPIGLFVLLSLMGMIYLKSSLVPKGIGSGENLILGEGGMQKKVLPVPAFDQIAAGDGMQFQLVKGTESVEIEAEVNLLPYFETKVEERKLSIQIKEGYSIRPSENQHITIKVAFQNLNLIQSYDAAYVTMKDTIHTDKFRCDVHAGANAEILVHAKEIKLEAHSGSDLVISGSCGKLDAQSHSAGDIKAFNLICRNVANLSSHSGANIRLTALGVVNASAHSGADIDIKGSPKRVNGNSHSGGSISEVYD